MQDHRTKKGRRNSIPTIFQESSQKIAADIVKQFLTEDIRMIGLGSGRMAAEVVREISKLPHKAHLQCITTSTKTKLEAEEANLKIVDEGFLTELEIFFDGADQIDGKRNMIKGERGSLLKEKILHSAAKNVIIMAESTKYVESFNRSVPVEVHPFARCIVQKKLEILGGRPKLRTVGEDYVYVTENGNLILDTRFVSIPDVRKKEVELKNIAGVLEVGLFTRHANVYYKANDDGSFEKILGQALAH
ncbi:MAG TPA: ribose 5-phosphate isomerase A [Candidatus Bathyarchaeia archaeon]|nr:ribose 5-phosphate isomerase A [Candidatus Bathyarchaeia archaeon]